MVYCFAPSAWLVTSPCWPIFSRYGAHETPKHPKPRPQASRIVMLLALLILQQLLTGLAGPFNRESSVKADGRLTGNLRWGGTAGMEIHFQWRLIGVATQESICTILGTERIRVGVACCWRQLIRPEAPTVHNGMPKKG